jgi:hypothetical protein
MAHKTLIGGTAYNIKGGRDLIGGTGYSKKNGKVLIDGTVHAIEFVKKLRITIVNAIDSSNMSGSVIYNGKAHTSGTLEVEQGETVTIALRNDGGNGWCFVGVNGNDAASGSSHVEYTYTVTKNASIRFDSYTYVIAQITEE